MTMFAPHPRTPAGDAQPRGPWVMQQRWHNLLFAHWRVSPDVVQPHLPPGIDLDTYQGDAWVSIIPFHMTGVRLRWSPPIPTAHAFAELNVRTYVSRGGVAGIWFFSLDAESTVAVVGARLGAALPYYRASMDVRLGTRHIDYRSVRVLGGGPPAVFDATYSPCGSQFMAHPGSLDAFLTERYSLFSSDGRRLWQIDVSHPPWELHSAIANIRRNTMLDAAGLEVSASPPLLHFATSNDVRFWPPTRVD